MQITIKIRGILKIVVVFGIVIPCILFFAYKTFLYVRREVIIYLKTNKKFKYTFESSDTSLKGYMLLTPSLPANLDYGKLVIIDFKGTKVLEQEVKGVASDFRQWKVNGQTRYSYMVHDVNAYQALAPIGSGRHAVILDSELNEIRQVHLLSNKDIVVDKRQDLDHHDLIMLSDDHYITISMYIKKVTNIPPYLVHYPATKVAAPIVQEIEGGKVVWQWDGSDYPEFYLNSTLGNKFYDTTAPQDYTHINSISIDPRDSNLLISMHNTNQVIKVSRRTGEILWRLGGRNSDFPLTTDQVFLRQHHATLIDSNKTLLLLDNGEKSVRPYSRVVEYMLDEQNKKIISFKAVRIPAAFAGTRGSVQKFGNLYFICGGSANYVLLLNSVTGKKVMELKTNQPLYRAFLVKDINGVGTKNKAN